MLFASLLISFLSFSQSLDRQLELLNSSSAQERSAALRWIAEHASLADAEKLRLAVRNNRPETRLRLAELLSVRPAFFPSLVRWLSSNGEEAQLAQAALLRVYRGFQESEKRGPEELSPLNLSSPGNFLKDFSHAWISIPATSFSFIRFIDSLQRFDIAKKPILLDPNDAELWLNWNLENYGKSDFLDAFLPGLLESVPSSQENRRPTLRQGNGFFWIGNAAHPPKTDEDAYLMILRAWNSDSPSIRRIAALDLGNLGISFAEDIFIQELLNHGPAWKEAIVGLTASQGVFPKLRRREVIEALLRSFEESPGLEREIAHTLIQVGTKDSEGRVLENLYRDEYKKTSPSGKLAIEAILSKLAVRSILPELLSKLQNNASTTQLETTLTLLSAFEDPTISEAVFAVVDSPNFSAKCFQLASKLLLHQDFAKQKELLAKMQVWASKESGMKKALAFELLVALGGASEHRWVISRILETEKEETLLPVVEILASLSSVNIPTGFVAILEDSFSKESNPEKKILLATFFASSEIAMSEKSKEEAKDLLGGELEIPNSKFPGLVAKALGWMGDDALRVRLTALAANKTKPEVIRLRALLALRAYILSLPYQDRRHELGTIQMKLAELDKDKDSVATFYEKEFNFALINSKTEESFLAKDFWP